MAGESTANFLRLLNASNAAIADRVAKEAKLATVGVDPIRQKREDKRREQWGMLRAREHVSSRPREVRSVFGYTDVT